MNPPTRLLDVFNRYLQMGGEEKAVDQIHKHLSLRHSVTPCYFDSAEWTQKTAPGLLGQACRFVYNPESRARFEQRIQESAPQAAIFHNIYPVGSPSLYRAALKAQLPVIQFLHNYRPFSVGGSLFYGGKVQTDPLYGDYSGEVRAGAWQQSVIKSGLCALMLLALRRSGWLESVQAWVCISQFMRDRIADAGVVPKHRLHVLRHSWDAMPEVPAREDNGSYLFLGRLIPEKGLVTLVQTWHELRKLRGDQTPILKIAGDGTLTSWLQQQAALNPSIRLLGHISGREKFEALRTCRCLVAPSIWWEPLGLMIYEAYDYAKPVLAAGAGGLMETVQQGKTGFLHEPGNVSALVKDVLTMESLSSDQRLQWGDQGRAWLLRETNVKVWQDRFDEVLASLVLARKNETL